jgi:hypothetical protein
MPMAAGDGPKKFRSLCPKCRYPMLRLCEYDGTSSASNRDFERDDCGDFGVFGVIALGLRLLFAMVPGLATRQRRARAAAIKQQVLPQFPNSLICPICCYVKGIE